MVVGLQHDLELGRSGGHVEEHAVVDDLHDVGAGSADDRGDPTEDAGLVGDLDLEPSEAARAHEAAHDHRGEQAGVDVAAAEHHAHVAIGEQVRVLEQGGDPGRAGALDHHLLDLEQEVDGLFERLLGGR